MVEAAVVEAAVTASKEGSLEEDLEADNRPLLNKGAAGGCAGTLNTGSLENETLRFNLIGLGLVLRGEVTLVELVLDFGGFLASADAPLPPRSPACSLQRFGNVGKCMMMFVSDG